MKRWNYNDVKEYVENLGCKLLTTESNYKNTKVPITYECSCGETFSKSFYEFRRRKGYRCRKCSGKGEKWTYEKVKELIESDGNKLLSTEYINNKQALKIQCKCGNVFYRNLHNYIGSEYKNCTECTWKTKRRGDVENFINLKGDKLLSEYINNSIPLKIQCKCGDIFYRSFADYEFNKRYHCHKCSGNNYIRHTYNDVKNIIESHGNKLLSTEYTNNSEKLKIQCKCGNVFYRNLNNIKDQNQWYCNKCAKTVSKGELKIKECLNELKISYKVQYKFEDCKVHKELPFDFYLTDLNICIEYDGKQHYEIGCFGGDLDDYINLKIRDTIKTIYCEKNNIKLIRIPYWEYDNIKLIINNIL